ncbi:FAD-dependent oxidoreductase [Myxococcota bacterium]|nr:FAD-dependent oxidoreductase [Myxococcota bacterium]
MSEIKQATVVLSEAAGPGFHTIVADAEAPLDAAPGQWGAFHTELPNPEKPGQNLRRAWSFSELDGRRFRLFVATVGPCTRWLADRRPGDPLPFTGPWGARFRLDERDGPAAFFAVGSGISPVAAMIDACVARGRPARLLWETSAPSMGARLAAWRAAGVEVQVGPELEPSGPGLWWFAGDGPRLDQVVGDAPPERVERFYTPRPVARAGA